jgi:hypothetical protein
VPKKEKIPTVQIFQKERHGSKWYVKESVANTKPNGALIN